MLTGETLEGKTDSPTWVPKLGWSIWRSWLRK